MNCQETEELLGAYALGALTPDAAADVELHLGSCTKHEDVAELRAVAQSLMLAAPEVEPPPALKAKLMDAVRRDNVPSAEVAGAGGIVTRLRRVFSHRPIYALAGGLAAAGMAIIALALLLPSGGDDGSGALVRELTGTADATGEIVYEDRNLEIAIEDLDAAPAQSVYQIWSLREGQPTSLGFLDTVGEASFANLDGVDLRQGDTVAITLEPRGGSSEPTTPPILAALL